MDALHSATKHTVSSLAALGGRHGCDAGLEAAAAVAVTGCAGGQEQAGVLALGRSLGSTRSGRTGSALAFASSAAALTVATAGAATSLALIASSQHTRQGLHNLADEFVTVKALAFGVTFALALTGGSTFTFALALAVTSGSAFALTGVHLFQHSGEFGKDVIGGDVVHVFASLCKLGGQVREHLCNQLGELFLGQFHNSFTS